MTFFEYLALEREEMLKHKWIESEKAGCDLGQKALFDWIEKYAEQFHRAIHDLYGPLELPCRQSVR